MLKSWVLLLASDRGNGSSSSGSPAQEAAWPDEMTSLRRSLPKEEEDKAMKGWGFGRPKTRSLPESDVWSYGKGHSGLDEKPGFQAVDAWRAERGEQCLI